MSALVSDLNVCSNKGLSERFDSTIGAATVLMPFGGTRQLTPGAGHGGASCPCVGETDHRAAAWPGASTPTSRRQTSSRARTWPWSRAWRKLVAAGFAREDAYLTFQEYFEKLRGEPERWGKPMAAVLGALDGAGRPGRRLPSAARTPCRGSFEQLDVPPTLVSFATAAGHGRPRDVSRVQGRRPSAWRCIAPARTTRDGLPAAEDALRRPFDAGAER